MVMTGDHLPSIQRDAMNLHQMAQRAGVLGRQHIA
jgi:hypothetical protein